MRSSHTTGQNKKAGHSTSLLLVREAGLEPARPEWTLEPESSESANSTTRADSLVIIASAQILVKQKFRALPAGTWHFLCYKA